MAELETYIDVALTINGINYDVRADFISANYEDNVDGADTLSIVLHNEGGKYAVGRFYNQTIEASFVRDETKINTNKLWCDEVSVDFVGGTIEIKAVSLPSGARDRSAKSRSFKGQTLKQVAEVLGREMGLKVNYIAKTNPTLKNNHQRSEGNLQYLKRLCRKYGLGLKFADSSVTVTDLADLGKATGDAVLTIYPTMLISGSGTAKGLHIVKVAKSVAYNPDTQKVESAETEGKKRGRKTESRRGADNPQDLAAQNEGATRTNQREFEMSLGLMGNPALVAGLNVKIEQLNDWDGTWLIKKATHAIDSSGYKTDIELTTYRK
jgi:hypothetical protein